jgi:hypothetical protein
VRKTGAGSGDRLCGIRRASAYIGITVCFRGSQPPERTCIRMAAIEKLMELAA